MMMNVLKLKITNTDKETNNGRQILCDNDVTRYQYKYIIYKT